MTFEEEGGRTLLVVHDRYPSQEALDAAIASGVADSGSLALPVRSRICALIFSDHEDPSTILTQPRWRKLCVHVSEEHKMIDGLKLTFSGDELRTLLDARIRLHEQEVARWTQEQLRDQQDASEEAPLLPNHICENEAERHAWRIRVLTFIRNHLDTKETYRLDSASLEFGELLPSMPGSVAQEEFEERNAVRFGLERAMKSLDGLTGMATGLLSEHLPQRAEERPAPGSVMEETDEFITRRLDLGDGPEVIAIQMK